jgi:hypothetical protein
MRGVGDAQGLEQNKQKSEGRKACLDGDVHSVNLSQAEANLKSSPDERTGNESKAVFLHCDCATHPIVRFTAGNLVPLAEALPRSPGFMKAIRSSISAGLFFCLACTADTQAVAALQENSARLLRWYQSRTVAAYQKTPGTNEAWDQQVIQAFELFAQLSADPQQRSRTNDRALHLSLSNAVEAGCNDALVRYLNLLHGPGEPSATSEEMVERWVGAARRMQKTKYATPLKFDAQIRPWTAWHERHGRYHTNPHPRVIELCLDESFKLAYRTTQETNTPAEVVSGVIEQMMEAYEKNEASQKAFYEAVQKSLGKNWPESAYVHLFRGSFYVDHAWHARGFGTANTVSREMAKVFSERLKTAEAALEKAWSLDPTLEKIALTRLRVELGQGRGREQMELWFRRAMNINSNSFNACYEKMLYLSPLWYGSAREIIDFGRECVGSTNWGGSVPWILIYAHEDLARLLPDEAARRKYWVNPEVWEDVKLACEKNLMTNPRGTNSARQAYIFQARRCEQWPVVQRHLALLTSTNVDYFGGQAEFDRMVRTVAEKSGPK